MLYTQILIVSPTEITEIVGIPVEQVLLANAHILGDPHQFILLHGQKSVLVTILNVFNGWLNNSETNKKVGNLKQYNVNQ